MDENNELEIIEHEKVDLTEHLRIISDDLLAISKSENDPTQKTEFFKGIKEELELVISELQEDMDIFHQDMPEKVAEICKDMDKNLMECQKLYENAIGEMLKFIHSENPDLIVSAKKFLDEAEEKMKKDDLFQEQLDTLINLN